MTGQPSQYKLSFISNKAVAHIAADMLMAEFDDIGLPVALFETEEDSDEWMVSVYLDEESRASCSTQIRSIVESVTSHQEGSPTLTWEDEKIEDADWVSKSLEGLEPVRARRYIVHGSHDINIPKTHEIAIQIDAGQAFGTGHHGTTKGCLEAIFEATRKHSYTNVLDLGTGSGVLAIAMAKTQPVKILATDIDPVAVQVAKTNIKLNKVHNRIRTKTANGVEDRIFRETGPFDLIIANILARPLEKMSRSVALNMAKGGDLILSGLLPHQRARIVSAYRRQGLLLTSVDETDSWITISMHKPGAKIVAR